MQKLDNSLFDNIINAIKETAKEIISVLDISKVYRNCCPYCANPVDNFQTHCYFCKCKLGWD